MNNFKIIIFGPQGSGKGTQAQMLSKLFDVPHISTGTVFRQIQQDDSDFAKLVRSYLDQGKLVPDSHVNKLVANRLKQSDCKGGFILDGYPRNRAQADFLLKQTKIDYVIVIKLPDADGIFRISKRRVCANGHSYHPKFAPPKSDGICDIDSLPLFQREDETEKAIKQRLAIYHNETEPLIEDLRKRGVKILEIDGRPAIEEVREEIKKKLGV
ncbi:MAG: nucleoside monophosphate kinase [Candidatus Jacksonbacteria bacterium]